MLYKTIHWKKFTIQNQHFNVIQNQLSLGQSNLTILLTSFPKIIKWLIMSTSFWVQYSKLRHLSYTKGLWIDDKLNRKKEFTVRRFRICKLRSFKPAMICLLKVSSFWKSLFLRPLPDLRFLILCIKRKSISFITRW